jgi:hypothetical protein
MEQGRCMTVSIFGPAAAWFLDAPLKAPGAGRLSDF